MSDASLQSQVDRRRALLNDAGKKTFGMSPESNANVPPAWYDPVKFKHAQYLFKKYALLIYISQFYGIILTFKMYNVIAPFLSTGRHNNVSRLYVRYLSTIVIVRNWFTYDLFDKKEKSFQSIKAARGAHRTFGAKLNATAQMSNSRPGDIWFSQHSMVLGQCIFVGLMAIFPRKLGFHFFNKNDFHCIFHFWRVIGYCLGIEDRFNLCSGTDKEIIEQCRQMFFHEWIPEINSSPEKVGTNVGQGLCLAMRSVNPIINYNSFLNYASPFMMLNRNEYPINTFTERSIFYLLTFFFNYLSKSKMLVWILTKFVFIMIHFAVMLKAPIVYVLEKCYDGHLKFELNEQQRVKVEINHKSAFDLNLY